MIIDAHCHAGHGDILTAPWNTDAPLEPFLTRSRQAGIGRTCVFALHNADMDRANEGVAELVRQHPDRLIGFIRVHPVKMAGRVREALRRCVVEWGFRGIKVHGSDGLPNREVMAAAAEFALPILVDVKDLTGPVEMAASQFPQVNLIVAHLGSFGGDWVVHLATIDLMCRYPNVYADSSSVRFFDYLAEAVRRAGPEKLIFGTDGPLLHPGLELMRIKLLNLPPADEAKILGGNIERLMRPPG